MHGIFLHVLADTMGSVAVCISTIFIYFFGWTGFDPIASCVIAVLIFISAIPLVASCARTLLLTIPADTEYLLRETLGEVSQLRGVSSYTVPHFWLEDPAITAAQHEAHTNAGKHDDKVEGGKVLGVIHIIASKTSDLDDVRERTVSFLRSRGLDVVVQVEREGETRCWCGGGPKTQ
jgi:zinc transporter 5/7